MQKLMDDQLTEGNWDKALRDFIYYFSIYQKAFIRGPIFRFKKKKQWKNGEIVVKTIPVIDFEVVSPFDVYPARGVNSEEDGTIHLKIVLSRNELFNLMKDENYDKNVISDILDVQKLNVSLDSESVEYERKELEGENSQTASPTTDIFKGFEFYGSIAGWMLEEYGMDIEDKRDSYEIRAIVIENKIISIGLNPDPLGRKPIYGAAYQTIPNSFWGVGLPESMEDVQRQCNGCARALSDNLSISCLTGDTLVVKHNRHKAMFL